MLQRALGAALRGALGVTLVGGCGLQGGSAWMEEGEGAAALARGGEGWVKAPPPRAPRLSSQVEGGRGVDGEGPEELEGERLVLREHGTARDGGPGGRGRGEPGERGDGEPEEGIFRNTYYDFPSEGVGAREATLFDGTCAPLAAVTRAFHDAVCVQGSGKLASGGTVSFAKRGCACADVCPRTGQKICYERLDPARFPHGRGAMGTAITPLRTVAVDSEVIPLGSPVFIPELVGLPFADGAKHDGCFLAEDRGIKVVGRQVDVFTGDPGMTQRWNTLFPSNRGVHVVPRDPRCAGLGRRK
ncbi:3D domain-containing protein [Chondromyces crocatus]|uniref:3D domain-containing protein n=1 Tax=Chondromyces crocatus TaxID=52 RepID=A0A0K1EA59_CHOCO|nr:3D domain-containing protein [Chondromyces crocatus]AKT37755.1 uncharacterized protein CMC5_018970 [Chondromyces crocatus]